MSKEESVVKSFRIPEGQFEQANEIFKKEGFSLSEVIRLVCDATIREGRIPRALSTKEMETKLDAAQKRESFIDSVLGMAGVVPEKQRGLTIEERLLKTIFGEKCDAADLSNGELREWSKKWGLPDNLAISTLADLHDCGLFTESPWRGAYAANITPVLPFSEKTDDALQNAVTVMEFENNIKDNLEQIKRQMQIRSIKYLYESDNAVPKKEKRHEED